MKAKVVLDTLTKHQLFTAFGKVFALDNARLAQRTYQFGRMADVTAL